MDSPHHFPSRKFARHAGLLILAGGLLASCDGYSFIDSIQFEADPDITLPAGQVSFNLLDMGEGGFNAADTLDELGATMGGTASLYRTGVDDTDMKILLHMPIADIPLNFTEYLQSLDLTGGVDQAFGPVSFTVPSISFPTINIPAEGTGNAFDLNTEILSTLNDGMAPISISILEYEDETPSTQNITLNMSSQTATFTSGSLNIPLTLTSSSTGFTFTITEVRLLVEGSTVYTDTNKYTLSQTTTISINLENISLNNSPQIRLIGTVEGGTSGQTASIDGTPSFSADTRVEAVSGIDFTKDIPFDPVTISLGDLGDFVSAVVGTGAINLSGTAIPSGWSGFSQSMFLDIDQHDGLNLSPPGHDPAGAIIDLSGSTISTGDITISGHLAIGATNATLTHLQSSPFEPSCSITGGISNFTTVTVNAPASFEETISINQDLSNVAQWVDSITFNEIGLAIGINNHLPAGNDITVTVRSTGIGLDESYNYGAGSHDGELYPFTVTNQALDLDANPSLDLSIGIDLPGYIPGANTFTLNNITAGSTYSFGGSVDLIADWSQIEITTQSNTGTYPGGAGLDLSPLANVLPEGASFDEIPIYLYLGGAPASLNPMITLDTTYSYSESPVINIYLTNAPMGNAALPALLPDPSNPDFITISTSVLAADSLAGYLAGGYSRPSLAGVLEDAPQDFNITYTLSLGTASIVPSQLATLGDSLSADLVIIVPFAISVPVGGARLPASDQLLVEGDLLGRTFPPEGDPIDEAFDYIDGLSLNLTYTNHSGLPVDATMRAYPITPSGWNIEKTFHIREGSQTLSISLSETELDFIRNGAFIPEFDIRIPEGEHHLTTRPELSLGVSVTVNTDLQYTLEFGTSGEEE